MDLLAPNTTQKAQAQDTLVFWAGSSCSSSCTPPTISTAKSRKVGRRTVCRQCGRLSRPWTPHLQTACQICLATARDAPVLVAARDVRRLSFTEFSGGPTAIALSNLTVGHVMGILESHRFASSFGSSACRFLTLAFS